MSRTGGWWRRIAVSVVVALVASLGLAGAGYAEPVPTPALAQIYSYDGDPACAVLTADGSERGPPRTQDEITYDAVGLWSRGATACSDDAAPDGVINYDEHAPLVLVARAATTTQLPAQVAEEGLEIPDPAGVAANGGGSSTFYTVQSSDDAARLAGGGAPWPTSAQRAEFGPGVYAWGNADDAAAYASRLRDRGACVEVCEFSISTGGLRQVDVDSLADPGAFMSRFSQLWGGTPSHGFDYITRGTQFGTQHYFSPSAFGSATWRGSR